MMKVQSTSTILLNISGIANSRKFFENILKFSFWMIFKYLERIRSYEYFAQEK